MIDTVSESFTKTSAAKRHITHKNTFYPKNNGTFWAQTSKKSLKEFNADCENHCFLKKIFPLAAGLPLTSEVSRCEASHSFFLGF